MVVIDNLVAGRREYVHPRAQFEYADITQSANYLFKLFVKYQVRCVFNYAAYPYIPVSFERPLHVFAVNANGALNVINAAQEAGCDGILQVSSAEIYGEGAASENYDEQGHCVSSIDEGAPVAPRSSYGAAKAAIDAMVQVRWKEARTPCIALRQFNCLGERETHPYVVPEIISQLARNDNWTEYEPGVRTPHVRLGNNSFRDFLYAGDAVRAAVELLEKGRFGEVYNLGSESGIKIHDLAKKIGRIMGHANVKVDTDPNRLRPWEIWHLQSDNAKINAVIDYRPQYDLHKALQKTIAYYLENGSKWSWEK